MVGVGGVGVGGVRGAGTGGPAQTPKIIFKVVTGYAPLFLPFFLHDLPENYMNSLPKITGEGDLTTT
jgi:hypothetical protein